MVQTDAEAAGVTDEELNALGDYINGQRSAFLADLERLVNIDCGSYTKAGVDEVGRWVAERLRTLGLDVRTHHNVELGDTVVGTLEHRGGGSSLLLIGHMDTVFEPGTAAERPFRIEEGRAHGPGVTDMKSGLLAGLYAIEALRAGQADGHSPFARLTFVANPDEEVGSPVSTPIIRELAANADACFVLECARANGDIVSSRKGISDVRLTVHGRAAHAGVEPEKGRNAIVGAARLVTAIHELNGRWPSVTANVGVIRGGTRPNVVPSEATLEVDIRAAARPDQEAAEAALRDLATSSAVPDTSVDVELIARHWPMEKLERSGRLVDYAKAIAGRLGFPLEDAATGGASDANTTAGMGIPTLDGLGPIGGLDHSPEEYLEVDSIVPRTTLLAGLLLAVARDKTIAARRSRER